MPGSDSLTGIRAWAATWVLTYHAWVFAEPRSVSIQLPQLLIDFTPFLSCGWAGVQIFFVLSGFLLALPYAEWQSGLRDKPRLVDYFSRRILRVFPAYYFQLSILVLLMYGRTGSLPIDSWVSAFRHFFMLFIPIPLDGQALNGVWWTLPIEFSFYLALPVIAALLKPGRAYPLLFACLGTMLIWRYSTITMLADSPLPTKILVASQLPGSLDSFGIGIIGSIIYVNRKSYSARLYSILTRTFIGPLICFALVVILLYWIHWWHFDYWTNSVLYYSWTSVFSLAILGIILAAAEGNKLVSFLFGSRVIIFIGTISYGLYLWHFPIMDLIRSLNMFVDSPFYIFPSLLGMAMLASLVVAALSYHLIERPFMLLPQKRLQKMNGKPCN